MNKLVNHINYPDKNSQIYCRKQHKVITLDKDGKFWKNCNNCPMFAGDYQGLGVECRWEDNSESYSEYVSEPVKELLRVSKEIDSKNLEKNS